MPAIDLNSDLGESYGVWQLGDDEAMLEVVSSANVACGFHAGDPPTLRWVCATAAANGVAIGAQVSYPDLAGFGRRAMAMDPAELRDAVLYQIGALDAFARLAGTEVKYVKPHGALYHAAAAEPATARAVVAGAREYRSDLVILGLPGSQVVRAAESSGLRAVGEGFADRAYQPDGSLLPRGTAGAVITETGVVAERVVRMATDGEVVAVDGSVVSVHAESICVHGDTPGAVDMARAVRELLTAAGIGIERFVS